MRFDTLQTRDFVDFSGFDGAGTSWFSEVVLGILLKDEPAASLCFDFALHVVG
ncbi:hypothetical protein [Brevibacterium sp. HMSC063G07]|uniref:hypothetical protein n=1 Tax=Brevibacterium sp. HMSC063G07 TaxID=1739261 RepID=UPI00210D748E|nr:hypothetical protein [Brevibacterium sp. HMSC063G07]